MTKLLKIVRDPIWQAVGVLVSIVAIFISTSAPTSQNGELAIIKTHSISFADYLLPSKLIKLKLPSESKDMDGATVDYYSIFNKGGNPIRQADYAVPLSVEQKGGGEIFLVDSCTKPAELQASKAATSCKTGAFVSSSWRNQDNKWIQEQALLNSSEQFCVVVIRKNHENFKNTPLTWGGRIVGTKITSYDSLEEYSKTLEKGIEYYTQTTITLTGYGAYWFIFLQVSIFYATLLLSRQAHLAHPSFNSSLWPTVVAMVLSTSTSEILIDIFLNQNTNNLSPVVLPLLIAHMLFIIFLVVRGFKLRGLHKAEES